MKEDEDLFDFSEYPDDYALYSAKNKKVLEKLKGETKGTPILDFVWLRSKM